MSGHPPNVVVGGGLASMAAAFALHDRGEPVVLLERRPFLGGRAFSFLDPDTGAGKLHVSFLVTPDVNVPMSVAAAALLLSSNGSP